MRESKRTGSTKAVGVCVALTAALVSTLAGCGDDHDVDSLDSRVVNGVVQRPGGSSYFDQQWVREQTRADALDSVSQCMEKGGRRTDAATIDSLLAQYDGNHWSALPSPEEYRRLGVDPYPGGLTQEESDTQEAAIGCLTEWQDDNPDNPAALSEQVESVWVGDLQEYFAGHDFSAEFATFESCLKDKTGYPGDTADPGSSPDVYGFLYWWPGQHGGEENMSHEDNLEGGTIYADCLDPYTDAQAKATDDMRATFIDEHYDDLKKINDELVG